MFDLYILICGNWFLGGGGGYSDGKPIGAIVDPRGPFVFMMVVGLGLRGVGCGFY